MSLCGLDFKIINSLKDNARKPIVNIANELGVSVKTVRRRLTRMIKNNLIELTIEWYPDKSDDIMTLLELRVQSDANIATVAYQIQKKYSTHTLFFYIYANISNTIMFVTWTNNMQELKDLRENIEKEFQVISAIPYVLTTGYIFETWRDQLAQKTLSISST